MLINARLKQPLSILVTLQSIIRPTFEEARIHGGIDFNLQEALALDLKREHVIALKDKLHNNNKV
jgi:hypothetical protein